ncbi:TetR/AcrR family transcriptional regulator [Saccharopolyspora rhizosphaerae]|uniref:TetR/AcrR family transcriptional regulator n=1 Tax=Saccharopolyspora rhizosphaerae TaxID=2492662 RepID=A0A3R8PB18_9PSEU|nr:TetR/AcrR family transcriptional regulator [Saccharopolyspora rhizosphaerae]RRO20432.1 TetR/AcrR family transcriptional regulator [Saccharopolyspora rhizosphaerae]
MATTPLRVYGGVTGSDRQAGRRAVFIEAGLELLGAPEGEPNLTVRGVCRQAGLANRYFYENFRDRDELATAVYDHVVDEIATTALDAVVAVEDPELKVRTGLATIVRLIAEDPRRGRLLFSPFLAGTPLAHRRTESTRLFTQLLGTQARQVYRVQVGVRLELLSSFLVGGLAQTLTSWLDGDLQASESEVVEWCSEIFLATSGFPQ